MTFQPPTLSHDLNFTLTPYAYYAPLTPPVVHMPPARSTKSWFLKFKFLQDNSVL